MKPVVDLVVNTFERTYRKVLKPGFFSDIEEQNRFPFTRRVALINNVLDRGDARARARRLVEADEISAFYFVDEYLDRALEVTGLDRKDLGRILHYSDCALVAVTLDGAPWLLYWDAEVRLEEPANWIEPAVELMEKDSRILVANPNWNRSGVERETAELRGEFALGYGFSDQLFLARRTEFARPVYKRFCPASLRYPLAPIAPHFEQWVDAYMRSERRLRATCKTATYTHPRDEGVSYPPLNVVEKLRLYRNRLLIGALKRFPTSNPCWRA